MMQANVTFRGCLVAFLCALALALCFIVPAERERLARLDYVASRLGVERRELAASPFSMRCNVGASPPRAWLSISAQCLSYKFHRTTTWAQEHAAAAPITPKEAERTAVAVMGRYLGARSGAVAIRSTDFDETRHDWVVEAVLGAVQQRWVGPQACVELSAYGHVVYVQAWWPAKQRAGTGR